MCFPAHLLLVLNCIMGKNPSSAISLCIYLWLQWSIISRQHMRQTKLFHIFFIFKKYIILSCSMYFSSLHCNTTSRRVDSFQRFFITHNSRSKWHYWDKKKSDRLWWASIDFYLQERKKTVIFDAAHEIIIKYLTNWSWEIWPNCLPCCTVNLIYAFLTF